MDAVRARRSADCVRRNRAVPISRRWDQALRDEREATVANKPGTPRRPRISRQPIAQGTPVVSAALWFLACAEMHLFCTQGSRVRPASGVPCALLMKRANVAASLGRDSRCGNAESHPLFDMCIGTSVAASIRQVDITAGHSRTVCLRRLCPNPI